MQASGGRSGREAPRSRPQAEPHSFHVTPPLILPWPGASPLAKPPPFFYAFLRSLLQLFPQFPQVYPSVRALKPFVLTALRPQLPSASHSV